MTDAGIVRDVIWSGPDRDGERSAASSALSRLVHQASLVAGLERRVTEAESYGQRLSTEAQQRIAVLERERDTANENAERYWFRSNRYEKALREIAEFAWDSRDDDPETVATAALAERTECPHDNHEYGICIESREDPRG